MTESNMTQSNDIAPYIQHQSCCGPLFLS